MKDYAEAEIAEIDGVGGGDDYYDEEDEKEGEGEDEDEEEEEEEQKEEAKQSFNSVPD